MTSSFSDSSSSWLKIGACVIGLAAVFYLTSDRSPPKPKLTKEEALEKAKETIKHMYPGFRALSVRASAIRSHFNRDPNYANKPPQIISAIVLSALEKEMANIEAEACEKFDIEGGIGEFIETHFTEQDDEYKLIAKAFAGLVRQAGAGVDVVPPFYQLPEGLSPEIVLAVHQELKTKKLELFDQIATEMKNDFFAQVNPMLLKLGKELEPSSDALERISNGVIETEKQVFSNYDYFFPDGMTSLRGAVVAIEESGVDPSFQAKVEIIGQNHIIAMKECMKKHSENALESLGLGPVVQKVEEITQEDEEQQEAAESSEEAEEIVIKEEEEEA